MSPELLHDPTLTMLRTSDGCVWRRHHALPDEGEHHPTGLWGPIDQFPLRIPRRGDELVNQGATPAAGVPVFHPGASPSGRGTATILPASDGQWAVHADATAWMPGQPCQPGELIHTGTFATAVSALHDWDEATFPTVYGTVTPDSVLSSPPARDPWLLPAFGQVTRVTVPRPGVGHVTLTNDDGEDTLVIVLSPERNLAIPEAHRDQHGWYFDWEQFGPVPAYQPRALCSDPHTPLPTVTHRGVRSWQAILGQMNQRAGTAPSSRFDLAVFVGVAEDAETFLAVMSEEEEIDAAVDPADPAVMRVTVRFGGRLGDGPGRVVLVPTVEYAEVTDNGEYPFWVCPGVTYPEA